MYFQTDLKATLQKPPS
jgi:hypothetical protein